jgi:hypothetical protein
VQDNNGLYTNEWLLADIGTNEIAMLELGTHRHKLWRSSKNEWFGNTPGFYWSCNSFKNMDVRPETIASARTRPRKLIYCPSERDLAWVKLYDKHRGRIGTEFVREFCESDVLVGPKAVDGKFTTTALAQQMKSWAVFGPPNGKTRNPTQEEKHKYPKIKPLTKHEWALLGTTTPVHSSDNVTALVVQDPKKQAVPSEESDAEVVWRGTLLPETDADIWLALAFADYHDLVALDKKMRRKSGESRQTAKLQEGLQECRERYGSVSKSYEVALADIKVSAASDAWYWLASTKGVLLLHQLRLGLGAEAFDRALDDFGMRYGGQRVTSQQFRSHLEIATGLDLGAFFAFWLREKGLPK